MKRLRHRLTFAATLVVSAVLLFLVPLDSALADDLAARLRQNRVTQFTAYDASCELINEGVTTVDEDTGITRTAGTIYRGVLMSDNPLFNGTSYIVVDAEVNQETEETKVWVTGIFYPDMVDGALITPGAGTVDETGPHVSHRGHGTGELEGIRVRFEVSGAEEPEEMPCEPLVPLAKLEGVIIDVPRD